MLDEFKKSISSALYERVVSPFYGTLLVSWSVWNWKIVYLTLFISESSIKADKISYILTNYSDIHHLVTYPLISTALLLTVFPFVTNGAFWLSLKFHKWKVDKKHEIERSQLLTLEQSIELRSEVAEKEKHFEEMLSGKNREIESLKIQLEELERATSPEKPKSRTANSSATSITKESREFQSFLDSGKIDGFIALKDELLKDGWFAHEDIDGFESAMAFGLVQHQGSGAKLSAKGKEFFKWLILNEPKNKKSA